MLLLLTGASMRAQSIAAEQMDERFNDGTKMPYGWFAEGWSVDDGKAKAKATEDSGNNGMPGMGTGGNPSENPSENPSQSPGMPGMGSMFGGDRLRTYLLTPPVSVGNGEKLVFSVRKPNAEGFSFDLKAMMGMSDTIFVVERSEYGKNQWLRVGDYTTVLSDDFQTFTLTGTPKGEYRFRFISYVDAEIDSVAGFHIDNEAPDLLVTVDSLHALYQGEKIDSLHTQYVDFSVCDKDSTKQFIVINTGTGTLKVNISSANAKLFSVDQSELSVAAGDSATVNVTFHYAAGTIGKNEALLTFTPADQRVVPTQIKCAAVITEPGVWFTDFNDNQLPFGCYGENYVVKEGVATHYNPNGGGMAAMFGGGGASDWFMTPPLTIKSENNAVIFSIKNGDDGFYGPIYEAQANVTIEKSVYGSNEWKRLNAHQFKDTDNHVKWISWLPAGDYRFRLVCSDSLCIDSMAGGFIRMDAPDLLVRHNGKAVQAVNFGIVRDSFTKTFTLINTGTAPLQLYAMSSDPTMYTLSEQVFNIEAGKSATVDVTFHYNPDVRGAHPAALVLTPTNCQIATQMIYLSAYITYDDAWSENFDPEFEVQEGEIVPLPEDWSTTGWQVIKGGGMDMMAMMGMGGGAEKTFAPHTDSDAYELITPRKQAQKGDVLRFYADISSGWLNVFYKRDGDMAWTFDKTYITADSIYFIAPYSGVYQLKFTGSSAAVDDFLGFRTPLEEIAIYDGKDNSAVLQQYDGQTVNVKYDRVLSAVSNGKGGWNNKAYTFCLPYDMDFEDYYESDQVKLYRLVLVDDYYKQFVFTNVTEHFATRGMAYLAVVEYGSVSLNAKGVTITSKPTHEEFPEFSNVYSYKDFLDHKALEDAIPLGTWRGTFNGLPNEEATALAAYGLYDKGTMKIICSDSPAERTGNIGTFRGFYEPKNHQSIGQKSCSVMFIKSLAGDESSSELEAFPADSFEDEQTTGIGAPIFHVIEADGSHRYFNLQGQQLNGEPDRGIYIYNGKKYNK